MSHYATSYVMAKDVKSTPAKLVLICLSTHVNAETGRAHPGQKLLASEASMGERQVRAALSSLDEQGLIRRTMRFRIDGTRTSDEYELVGFLDWHKRAQRMARETTGENPPVVGNEQPADFGIDNRRKTASKPEGEPEVLSVSNETGKSDSDEPGDTSPQKQFWDESTTLITECEGEVTANHRKQIGKWVKQSKADYAVLLKLLAAVRATGTRDPISYLHKAVNENWPPPKPAPKPSTIDSERWKLNIEVAKKMHQWSERWGPPPGAKGCHVPPELITADVLAMFKPEGALT